MACALSKLNAMATFKFCRPKGFGLFAFHIRLNPNAASNKHIDHCVRFAIAMKPQRGHETTIRGPIYIYIDNPEDLKFAPLCLTLP